MPIRLPVETSVPRGIRAIANRLLPCVCLAVLTAATPVRGQTAAAAAAAPAADHAAVAALEALIQRVDQLEAEVRALRAQLATRAAEPDPTALASVTSPGVPLLPAAVAHDHAAADAAAAEATDDSFRVPRTQFHWFSDVGYSTSDRTATTSSFGLGQLDLFLTSALNEHWSVLSEIVFRANTDNRFVVNPERLLLQYRPSDAFQVGMGRFHSAVGYYNAAYHHGSWFETAAARPSIFAAGFVPYHNVGLTTHTRIPSGAANLEAIAEIGNGLASSSRTVEPTQSVIDENNHKATNLGLITRPRGLPGFQAGVSWYRDRLVPTGHSPFAAHLSAAHAVYTGHDWEILNEVIVARHVDEDGAPARVSYGWYSQGSYRIGSVRPYLRYQAVDGRAGDPLFGSLGHRAGPVAGIRVDFGRFAALKVHVDRSTQSTGQTTHDGVVKLAFTF